ncbi:MAG: CopG family transcriptional regulator [Dehalococcoidia bacterium]|nr:CopG family transcriptional regulator [Dehalococcoidia bacterium]
MPKKVIQVPIDPELLAALDQLSRKRRKARAELIRDACQQYLVGIQNEEMDRRYKDGYEAVPDDPQVGEAQAEVTSQVLPQESW